MTILSVWATIIFFLFVVRSEALNRILATPTISPVGFVSWTTSPALNAPSILVTPTNNKLFRCWSALYAPSSISTEPIVMEPLASHFWRSFNVDDLALNVVPPSPFKARIKESSSFTSQYTTFMPKPAANLVNVSFELMPPVPWAEVSSLKKRITWSTSSTKGIIAPCSSLYPPADVQKIKTLALNETASRVASSSLSENWSSKLLTTSFSFTTGTISFCHSSKMVSFSWRNWGRLAKCCLSKSACATWYPRFKKCILYSFIKSGLPIAAAALRFVKLLLYFFSHFLPLLTAPLETKIILYCPKSCEAWKTIFSRILMFKFPPSLVITDEPTLMTTMGLSFFI